MSLLLALLRVEVAPEEETSSKGGGYSHLAVPHPYRRVKPPVDAVAVPVRATIDQPETVKEDSSPAPKTVAGRISAPIDGTLAEFGRADSKIVAAVAQLQADALAKARLARIQDDEDAILALLMSF